jgi:hypothetical protein
VVLNRIRTNFDLLPPVKVIDLEPALIYRLAIDRNRERWRRSLLRRRVRNRGRWCGRLLRRRVEAGDLVEYPSIDQGIPRERPCNIRV